MARTKKTQALYPAKMISMQYSSDAIEGLNRLEASIRQKALQSVAAAGALVFYDEMRRRVPIKDGELYASIYRWHDDKRSTQDQQIYWIGPNKVKAPHWHLIEFGHWKVNKTIRVGSRWIATTERLAQPTWVAAKPYARPTFDAARDTAYSAMKVRLAERIKEFQQDGASP